MNGAGDPGEIANVLNRVVIERTLPRAQALAILSAEMICLVSQLGTLKSSGTLKRTSPVPFVTLNVQPAISSANLGSSRRFSVIALMIAVRA